MCKQNPENQDSDKTEVKHIDTEEQSPDYAQSECLCPTLRPSTSEAAAALRLSTSRPGLCRGPRCYAEVRAHPT